MITLWVEALPASASLEDRSITFNAVYAEEHTGPYTRTLLPYSYVRSMLIPLAVADI